MWPFKKKEFERNAKVEAIAKLKAFRDVGETFKYLGRTCVVTGHWEFWPYAGIVPILKFDYCDDSGRLHTATARVSELSALVNQQEQTKPLHGAIFAGTEG